MGNMNDKKKVIGDMCPKGKQTAKGLTFKSGSLRKQRKDSTR